MIKKHLAEPDKLVRNPYYRTGPKMRLYALARVEEVEDSADVAAGLAKARAKRPALSEAAKRVADEKREQLCNQIRALNLAIPRIEIDALTQNAIASYNALWSERGNYEKFATAGDCPDFLKRITRNYIRHNLSSSYDDVIDAMYGLVGKSEAYILLREIIDAEIDEVYPMLVEAETPPN